MNDLTPEMLNDRVIEFQAVLGIGVLTVGVVVGAITAMGRMLGNIDTWSSAGMDISDLYEQELAPDAQTQ